MNRQTEIKIPTTVEEKEAVEKQRIEITQEEIDAFEGITYDRKYMDMYNDEMLWTEDKEAHSDPLQAMSDGSGSPKHVKIIDNDYYDKYIVDRATGEYLPGDTTWVIGMTTNVAYDPNTGDHIYGLIMRSIRILNDHFYQEDDKVRFGIVNFYEHEYIKESLNGRGPVIWVVKDGIAYRNRPVNEIFHKLYKFIEIGYMGDKVYEKVEVRPRLGFIGLY